MWMVFIDLRYVCIELQNSTWTKQDLQRALPCAGGSWTWWARPHFHLGISQWKGSAGPGNSWWSPSWCDLPASQTTSVLPQALKQFWMNTINTQNLYTTGRILAVKFKVRYRSCNEHTEISGWRDLPRAAPFRTYKPYTAEERILSALSPAKVSSCPCHQADRRDTQDNLHQNQLVQRQFLSTRYLASELITPLNCMYELFIIAIPPIRSNHSYYGYCSFRCNFFLSYFYLYFLPFFPSLVKVVRIIFIYIHCMYPVPELRPPKTELKMI